MSTLLVFQQLIWHNQHNKILFPNMSTAKSVLSRTMNHRIQYSIYTRNSIGNVVAVTIPQSTLTVNDAIQVAIQQFNRSHTLQLSQKTDLYKLYAANSNGTRISDFPELAQEQELRLINLRQFYLRPPNPKPKKNSTRRDKIISFFQVEKKPEKKVRRLDSCSCFGF